MITTYRKWVVVMTDYQLIQATLEHLGQLKKVFATELPGSADEQNMHSRLTDAVAYVRRAKAVDNAFLIEVEKFHRAFAFFAGLSTSKLTEEAHQAWRAYDSFHYEQIKPQLKVYAGGMFL